MSMMPPFGEGFSSLSLPVRCDFVNLYQMLAKGKASFFAFLGRYLGTYLANLLNCHA